MKHFREHSPTQEEEQEKRGEEINDKDKHNNAWLDGILGEIEQQTTQITVEEEERNVEKMTIAEREVKKALIEGFEKNNFEIYEYFQNVGIGSMDKDKMKIVFDDFSVREAATQAVVRAIESGVYSFDNFFDFNNYILPEIKNDIDIQDAVVKKMIEYADAGDFSSFRELADNFFKPNENFREKIASAIKTGLLKRLDDAIFPGVLQEYKDVIPQTLREDEDVRKKTKSVLSKLSKDAGNLNQIKILKNFFNIV